MKVMIMSKEPVNAKEFIDKELGLTLYPWQQELINTLEHGEPSHELATFTMKAQGRRAPLLVDPAKPSSEMTVMKCPVCHHVQSAKSPDYKCKKCAREMLVECK
jgi:hypothetical protein